MSAKTNRSSKCAKVLKRKFKGLFWQNLKPHKHKQIYKQLKYPCQNSTSANRQANKPDFLRAAWMNLILIWDFLLEEGKLFLFLSLLWVLLSKTQPHSTTHVFPKNNSLENRKLNFCRTNIVVISLLENVCA